MDWIPLLGFPLEWASLALLVAGCLYWERSGSSGLGVEGCVLSAMLGLCLGYEWSGSYLVAAAGAAASALAFAIATGALLAATRADPAVGSFCISLVPACALGTLARWAPLRLLTETPAPGLARGTVFDGTYAEDLVANPMLLAALPALGFAAFLLLRTPFGLKSRAFSETPALARRGRGQVTLARLSLAALGALWVVPAAAILLRSHRESPPLGLGFVALACAVAGRWGFAPAILLAAGPALLRAARPYAPASGPGAIGMDAAPFLLAAAYLVFFSRRALRASVTPESRLNPDVL